MRSGFTLLEVVVALLVLELAVVGVVGTLVIASSTQVRAESLERAVARAEGILDSLQRASGAGSGVRSYGTGEVRWSVDETGEVVLRALEQRGNLLFEVRSVLPRR